MGVFTGIVAIAKAIPTLNSWLNKLINAWVTHKVSEINSQRITKDDQRAVLLKAIDKAETNEELMALSVTLHSLNNGGILQLQDSEGSVQPSSN